MLDYLSPAQLLNMDKPILKAACLAEDVNGQAATVVEYRKGEITETYWFRQEDGLLVKRSALA